MPFHKCPDCNVRLLKGANNVFVCENCRKQFKLTKRVHAPDNPNTDREQMSSLGKFLRGEQ